MNNEKTSLDAKISKVKQEGKELISEGEYQRCQHMSLADFFRAAQAVRKLTNDGTLREIHKAARLTSLN